MKRISMGQLSELIESLPQDEVLLDVRSREEFREGHIPGALNIPHDEIARHLDELRPKKTIYIHCRSGGRAQVAAQALESAGIHQLTCVTDGGMPQWMQAGLPVERG